MNAFDYELRKEELNRIKTAKDTKLFILEIYREIGAADIFNSKRSEIASITKPLVYNSALIQTAIAKHPTMHVPMFIMASVYEIRRHHDPI